MCNLVETSAADREPDNRDNRHFFKCKAKCCSFCSYCSRAFSKERSKSWGSSLSLRAKYIKICEKCFLCHSIVICKQCNKCSQCCQKLTCRGQTTKVLEKVIGSGCRSEGCSNPERGLHPPLPDPAKIIKSSHSRKLLWQSSQKPETVRGITSAYRQKGHRTSTKADFTRVFQLTISSPQVQKQMATNPRPEQSEFFPQDQKIQDGDPGNHQNISPTGRMGNLRRLHGCLFLHSNTGTVQEVLKISRSRSDLSVQSSSLWPFYISHGVHYHSKGGKADGHSKGYKDPPIPRRLVGESHIPTVMSPTYTIFSENVPGSGLDGQHRKVGIEPKQIFNFVSYQFDLQSGRVRLTLDRWQNLQEKIRELLSLRTCSVREFMSLIGLLTATEKQVHLGRLHMTPIQWHLKNNWRILESLEKRIPLPRSLHPHLQWWLNENNVLTGQPLHPLQHALQVFTDASKEGWGAHLNEFTARGTWSLPESKLHINYLELKSVLLAL